MLVLFEIFHRFAPCYSKICRSPYFHNIINNCSSAKIWSRFFYFLERMILNWLHTLLFFNFIWYSRKNVRTNYKIPSASIWDYFDDRNIVGGRPSLRVMWKIRKALPRIQRLHRRGLGGHKYTMPRKINEFMNLACLQRYKSSRFLAFYDRYYRELNDEWCTS